MNAQKIDRFYHTLSPVAFITGDSFSVIPNNQNWFNRRKATMKILALNYVSKYIPMMIECADEVISNLKVGQTYEIKREISKITFKIITKILFGRDISERMPKLLYISPEDHSEKYLQFDEFFEQYCSDELSGFRSAAGRLFQFLVDYKLIEPMKTNSKNNRELFRKLKEFCEMSDDKDSMYNKLKESDVYHDDTIFNDIVLMLFGGFDTTSNLITSTLYNVKKADGVYEKI